MSSSLVKLPTDVLKRSEVTCHAGPLGVRLAQVRSGVVIVNGFQAVKPGTGVKGSTKGPVEASGGKVRPGDALLCINNEAIELMTYDMVLKKLRMAPRPIVLTFGRTSSGSARMEDKVRAAAAAARSRSPARRSPGTPSKLAKGKASPAVAPEGGEGQEAAGAPQAVYTARDFQAGGFGRYQKLFGLLFIFTAILVIMYSRKFQTSFLGEDDLQQYEEWKAQKALMDAERLRKAENVTSKDGALFQGFDLEKDVEKYLLNEDGTPKHPGDSSPPAEGEDAATSSSAMDGTSNLKGGKKKKREKGAAAGGLRRL